MSIVRSGAALVVFLVVGSLMPAAHAAPPSNDNFLSATVISGASGTSSGSTTEATAEPSEPNHAPPETGGASVWFAWTAPSTGRFRFDTIGSGFDTLLGVYTGEQEDGLAGLQVVGRNNNLFTSQTTSGVGFNAVQDTLYWIAVDGRNVGGNISRGSYTLNWKAGPTNDDHADATVIAGQSGNLQGTTTGATPQAGDPNGQNDRHSVWYTYVPATDGMLTLRNQTFLQGLTLGLYSGTFPTLSPVTTNSNGGSSPRIDRNVNGGTTYSILVSSSQEGNFPISWNLGPTLTNDNRNQATPLSGESGTTGGSSVGATRESGEIGGSFESRTVWFSFSTPSTAPVTFEVGGAANGVAVFQTPQGVCTNPAVCWNNAGNLIHMFRNGFPRSSFVPTANQTYWIQVSGGAPGGDYTLRWERPPANDNLSSASAISGSSGSTQGNNLAAGEEANELNHAGNAGGASVWYSWVAPNDDPVEFDTFGSDFDTILAVYTVNQNQELSHIVSNDNFGQCCQDNKTSRVGFNPQQGTTYKIVVDGAVDNNGSEDGLTAFVGDLVLNWNPSPPNDDFAGASLIEGNSGSVNNVNTVGATTEIGEPSHAGATVWYRWVASEAGRLEITTSGTPIPDRAVLYRGSSVNQLTNVFSSGDTDSIRGNVTAGTEYSIALSHKGNFTGPMAFSWQFTPAPVTQIIQGPTGTVNTPSVSFEFGPDQQGMSFTCFLDGRQIFQCPRLLDLNNLLNGQHTLTVAASEGGTPDPTPEERTWTVNAPPRERLDGTFDSEGIAATTLPGSGETIHDVATATGDKVVAVGSAFDGGTTQAAILRFQEDGAADQSFSGDGVALVDVPCGSNCQQPNQARDEAKAVVPLDGGKVLVAGDATTFQHQVCQFNNFTQQYDCFVQSSQRRVFLTRLNENGTVDTTFGTNGFRFYQENTDTILTDMVRKGDNLYLTGTVGPNGQVSTPFVGKLSMEGVPDPSFDTDGFATLNQDAVSTGIAVTSNDKPVVSIQAFSGSNFTVARWTANGAPDSTFSGDGLATHTIGASGDVAQAIAHDSQDRLVIAGRTGLSPSQTAVLRLEPDGDLDPTFNPCANSPAPCDGKFKAQLGTSDSQARDLLVLPNDRILIGVRAREGNEVFYLFRLTQAGTPDTSFSGDGRLVHGWTFQAAAWIESLTRDSERRVVALGTGSGVGDFVLARYTTDQYQLSVTVSGNGTVISDPEGIQCTTGTCNASFTEEETITLTATPDNARRFTGWQGDCSSTDGDTCTINGIQAARSVTASFVPIHNLGVTISGSGSVVSSPAGINCSSGTCNHAFDQGETITLTADPDENQQLTGWTGDCSSTDGLTCTIESIGAGKAVTATFAPITHELSVTVNGDGSVASDPVGVSCPSQCANNFNQGSDITLTATPGEDQEFDGWTGDCTSTEGLTCTVNDIAAARSVTANFSPITHQVDVTVNGDGTVASTPGEISCPLQCTDTFDQGTDISLLATPDDGQQFSSWSGDCSSTFENTCTIADVSAARSVTANFAPIQHQLSVEVTGQGAVMNETAGIECNGSCDYQLDQGTMLTLSAVPAAGWEFDGWSGGTCSGTGTCPVTMDEDKAVTAEFSLIPDPVFKPDVQVKKASARGFTGNDIYNEGGNNQTVSMNAKRGTTKTFNFKLQNDGDTDDVFEIDAPGNSNGFTVKYFQGDNNITSDVLDGSYEPGVAADASKTIKVTITVKNGAGIGKTKAVLLTATSANSDDKLDAAKAKVTVIRG